MGTVLTETENFDLAVEGPSTLSHASSAEMRENLTKLVNRDRYLISRVAAAEAGDVLRPSLHALDVSRFTFGTGTPLVWRQSDVTDEGTLLRNLEAPKKGVLTGVRARILPIGGHAGLPGTMPKLELYRQPLLSSAPVLVADATDTSANVTDYELGHNVELTGLSESLQVGNALEYFVVFRGEAGANSLVGLLLLDLYGICG
ncbi:MAG: hypothetical protein KF718_33325 [Polyangiaceae bacterium]|nr:hypothetical protein [Polyangiaceae bacterium]